DRAPTPAGADHRSRLRAGLCRGRAVCADPAAGRPGVYRGLSIDPDHQRRDHCGIAVRPARLPALAGAARPRRRYRFTATMAGVHMLTFPGLFSQTGLLGANPQTTAWLYMFWHAGFPLAVAAYSLLKRYSMRDERGTWFRLMIVAGLVTFLMIAAAAT